MIVDILCALHIVNSNEGNVHHVSTSKKFHDFPISMIDDDLATQHTCQLLFWFPLKTNPR